MLKRIVTELSLANYRKTFRSFSSTTLLYCNITVTACHRTLLENYKLHKECWNNNLVMDISHILHSLMHFANLTALPHIPFCNMQNSAMFISFLAQTPDFLASCVFIFDKSYYKRTIFLYSYNLLETIKYKGNFKLSFPFTYCRRTYNFSLSQLFSSSIISTFQLNRSSVVDAKISKKKLGSSNSSFVFFFF